MAAKPMSNEDVKHTLNEEGVISMSLGHTYTYKSVISSAAKANKSNFLIEENNYLLQWLYRIRRASCARGLRIGFLQPDFLCIVYGPMLKSTKIYQRNNDNIRAAVSHWFSNRAEAEERYGHISDWDVSRVTDMSLLLFGNKTFNDDISRWDVSNVTDMGKMFSYANEFNQPVGDWDAKVTNMQYMFHGAHAFNQPIGDWNVSKVTDMQFMFYLAFAFNQPVGDWDVSKVTNMQYIFNDARAFNQPIGDWNVSKVTKMNGMFDRAHSFNQSIGGWNVSKVADMSYMFYKAQSFNQDLTSWDMSSVANAASMFKDTPAISVENKPAAVREGK